MNSNNIIGLIKKYKLFGEINRNISFFVMSFIGEAYTIITKNIYGESYKAVGAIGKKDETCVLLDEDDGANQAKKILNSDFDGFINKKLPKTRKFLFETLKEKIELSSKLPAKNSIKLIIDFYSDYWGYFMIYNSLMRYIGNKESKGKLTKDIIKKLSDDRDKAAKIYLKIEDIIAEKAEEIGKKEGFDGDLLKYMTKNELKEFLDNSIINLSELKKRTKGYVYVFDGATKKDYITTDKNVINDVKNLFKVSKDIKEIMGHIAYPGKVRGIVRNLSTDRNGNISKENIIVIANTFPNDTPLVSKCSGLVTDEGGILSHASVISRELKIPCIVSTKIASKVFKDGDLVEVDANKGIVRKL